MVHKGLDFAVYIADRIQDFTGRGWVLEKVNSWLTDPGADRIFLLAGEPGTGKSAIAERLEQMSDWVVTDASFSKLIPSWLSYYHFCQSGLDSTLSPLTFVQALSEALANHYPAFRIALEQAGSKQNIFNIKHDE